MQNTPDICPHTRRAEDATPLHLHTITKHAAALTAFNIIGGADEAVLTAPTVDERFCRILTDADAVITLGTDASSPADPVAGDYKILANTPEWIQLPIDPESSFKARIKISGVLGGGNASVTWHK